ncbi:glycosyltransferase family 4 protein [Burkholderia cenocepacia]|uniref:glycosyltransferase family 4 protein n=1 Tax=Burkholderia cenocepacia TaxID=95486 RepID=UPI0011B44E14|nr:glycosyltransferase [Burkholderia cenocepacia]
MSYINAFSNQNSRLSEGAIMLQGLSVFPNTKKQQFAEYVKTGDAARDARAWERAVSAYQEALEVNPKAENIWVQLGHAQKELGMFGKAEASYKRALELNSNNDDTHTQLGHLFSVRGDVRHAVKHYRSAVNLGSKDSIVFSYLDSHAGEVELPQLTAEANGLAPIYFDYSDLVQYFRHNRFPTGIQRVQIELFKAAQEAAFDVPIRACAFVEGTDFWVEIDPIAFRRLCDLSSLPGETDDPVWVGALNQVLDNLSRKMPVRFPRGATLINIGTSWWIKDYGAYIRQAKQKYGLRYVPFVHDLIPLLTPEHCSKGLVQEFKAWIELVMLQADFIAVNSVNTQTDVVNYAKTRKALAYDPQVVRLDAEFARNPAFADDDSFVTDCGLMAGRYVLFVGTLESRKNHAGVFQAWKRMIAKLGIENAPMLVCVGKRGWLFDQANAVLESDGQLASKVLMLSGISDDELASLYRGCLFTVYASHYEGWGLPVTESLSFGKVCLSASNSSLPEAGGKFADYFDNDSVSDLLRGLEKLISDETYRKSREAEIASQFRPRRWEELLHDLVDGVTTYFRNPAAKARDESPVAQVVPGVLYSLALDERINENRATAETLRHELTWYPSESWGCWAKNKTAKLAFKLSDERALKREEFFVYMKVSCGPQPLSATFRLGVHVLGSVTLAATAVEYVRFRAKKSWLVDPQSQLYNVLAVDHRELTNMAQYSDGGDRRNIGIGFREFGLCDPDDFEFRLEIMDRRDMQVV